MASRDPQELTPYLKERFLLLQDRMRQKGYEVILTCSYRSSAEQDKLYAIGRTIDIGHRKVTNLRGGKSLHNKRPAEAFDIAILVNGKLIWAVESDPWVTARSIGKEIGLENLYPYESAHFQKKENV